MLVTIPNIRQSYMEIDSYTPTPFFNKQIYLRMPNIDLASSKFMMFQNKTISGLI